jgi:lipopolysaccharide export LptBFGC system permease protein LptF
MKIPHIDRSLMSLAVASLTLLSLQVLVVPSSERDAIATMERSQQPERSQPKDNITYYDIAEEMQPNGTKIKNLVRFFCARQFDGRTMTDAIAIDRSYNRVSRVIRAKSATLGSGKQTWDFYNGTVYEIDPKSQEPKTIKQFKRLRVSPSQNRLTLAVPNLMPEKLASKQDNITYAQTAKATPSNGDRNHNLERFFYARKFDGRTMTDIMTIDLSQPQVINITDAKSGKWDINKKSWNLANGTTYTIDLKSQSLIKTKFDRFQFQYL